MRALWIIGLAACATTPQTPPRCPCAEPPPPVEIEYEARPGYINFIPFGAGQFQNREPGKGTAFAVSQGITAATSAGIWFYLFGTYGATNGQVPISDGSRVRTLQQLEIASGVAFLGLATWGVIDAIVHHEPLVRIERSSWAVGPTLVPGGAGLGLAWSR